MGDPKISTFIVGLIFVSAVSAIFALLMADMATEYGVTYEGNDTTGIMNKLSELNSTVWESHDETLKPAAETNWLVKLVDIAGAILSKGLTALKVTFKSFGIFTSMTNSGLSRMGLGVTEDIIKTAIVLGVLVTIVVGVMLSILVRREV